MRSYGIADMDRTLKPVYEPIKLRQAFASSALVLFVGVTGVLLSSVELTMFGELGWLSLPLGAIAGTLLYVVVYWLTKIFLLDVLSMQALMAKLHSLFRNLSWPGIILISAMAGLGEELLLRGVIQTLLVEAVNPLFGIVVASLIFGAMHYLSRAYVIVTFALGAALGLAYYLSGSLILVMVMHAVYDVFAFAVLVKYPHLILVKTA